jgi:hypothetical protein
MQIDARDKLSELNINAADYRSEGKYMRKSWKARREQVPVDKQVWAVYTVFIKQSSVHLYATFLRAKTRFYCLTVTHAGQAGKFAWFDLAPIPH